MSATLYVGDCRSVMAGLEPESFDAIVCDPPYGLGFMGKDWDTSAGHKQFQSWSEAWAIAAYRVLKPGGYLLAFGGTRTFHRLTCGIEDAGFAIRDCLMWLYGSGFPKSLDISKEIDKSAGVEREVIGIDEHKRKQQTAKNGTAAYGDFEASGGIITAPVTADAIKWKGYGTALKPAWEPIILARKPIAGTVAANVLAYGTGGLNIDGCLIEFAGAGDEAESKNKNRHGDYESGENNGYHGFESRGAGGNYDAVGRWPANLILDESSAEILDEQDRKRPDASDSTIRRTRRKMTSKGSNGGGFANQDHEAPIRDEPLMTGSNSGRWPANLILDESSAELIDQQSGESISSRQLRTDNARTGNGITHGAMNPINTVRGYEDRGGASRFFYTAKASRSERNKGLDGMPAPHGFHKNTSELRYENGREPTPRAHNPQTNNHPTVKPVDLMQWLCRLVTPKGGRILDPFLGSGSTGIAAEREGFSFVGIDQSAEYVNISRRRITGDAPLFNTVEVIDNDCQK